MSGRVGVSMVVLGLVGAGAGGASGAGVLYDASLGTLPTGQGWQFQASPNDGPVTQSVSGGVLTLDTTPVRNDRAGYPSRLPTVPPLPAFPNHPGVGTLDRNAGFTLRIEARVDAEGHNTAHRSGFSVLVVCADLSAIEIGFWTDLVWAQDDDQGGGTLFTQGESVAFDTSAAEVVYELSVEGGIYRLFADGTPILGGALRDYTNATGLAGYVYKTQNMIFWGDNTSSADARTEVSMVSLADGAKAGPACAGDIDWNGATDVFDFAAFANHFGQSVAPGTNGDMDSSGFVDVLDFSIFASDFGCPTE